MTALNLFAYAVAGFFTLALILAAGGYGCFKVSKVMTVHRVRRRARARTASLDDLWVILDLAMHRRTGAIFTDHQHFAIYTAPDHPFDPLDTNVLIEWVDACRRGTQDPEFLCTCIRGGITSAELAAHLNGTRPLDEATVQMLADLAA